MILIDTSVWIEYFRDRQADLTHQVEALLAQRKARSFTLINAELTRGCLSLKEVHIIDNTIGQIPSFAIPDAFWKKIALFSFHLARKGLTVSLIDAAIAYVAIENKASLYTLDKDFIRIAKHSRLKLYG